MAVRKHKKIELLNYLKTGEPPKSFHTHAIGTGSLQEYCVFCKDPVNSAITNDHGYKIALYGKVPVPIDRNTIQFEDKELECTICINCSNDVANQEEEPTDTIGNLEIFIERGTYPHNIIEFSLSDSADKYCGFCRVDLDVYEYEDCESHTIGVGYHRNALESAKIPGPILLCPGCRDELRSSKVNGHFHGKLNYTVDVCCDCCENTIITQTEYDYRIDNPGDYLCHDCANERGLKGVSRMMSRTCADCGRHGKPIDVLIEQNSLRIDGIYRCDECERGEQKYVIRNYVGPTLCVEVYTQNKLTWTYIVFLIRGFDEEDDQILHTSTREWDESWKATFIGTLKAVEIGQKQLELPFDES